ncbi:Bug family tripartite tricarboxylate transporter substrate binding protein [Pseudoroseomonas ludipueritiae]|uniref:Tripartite tricarboxylate transporter substrate binding protein n=1 Tax=Pseudoroseomonas ludipueritiae TaxID=198093 RepID=A0ABR7RE65_9PROT|nr:tripartite tricarboxylate transporter substrate binding protein [Pseudoroseomonas ludipueritiae]MBC9180031.1 tripartite tricarboxylate transporter substrate binding protein [Pseudoroseomonas ludipueritiae]
MDGMRCAAKVLVGRRGLMAAGLTASLVPAAARAADYPSRPVRIVVAFSPGGEPDILIRAMAPAMQEALGQPVVVDNRPGATTIIAAEHVSQAPADGYTLLLTSSTTFAVTPHLFKKLPYRLEQFRPIALLMRAQLALYSNPRLPVRSVAELVAYARKQPEPVTFTTTNRGAVAHLSGERMKQVTGIAMTDVPFRASSAAAQALIRGDVDVGFDGVASYVELVKAGEIRALAVTGEKRVAALPDTPTFAEAGFPDVAQPYWYGLFAPAGVPDVVVEKVLAATRSALKGAALGSQMQAQGATLEGTGPEAFARLLTAERESWGALIRGIGLKLD